MSTEIDHVFICCSVGGHETEVLTRLGLKEGSPNTHTGQGTACRRFFFSNAYLELLWVSDPIQAQAEASAFFEQALAINRETGSHSGEAHNLGNLGDVADRLGDYATAETFLEKSLVLNRDMGVRVCEAFNLNTMGNVALHQGVYEQAQARYAEGLKLNQELGNWCGSIEGLGAIAKLVAAKGIPDKAARLWGAAEKQAEGKTPLLRRDLEEYKCLMATAQEALGEVAFSSAWAEGRALTLEQAIALALEG